MILKGENITLQFYQYQLFRNFSFSLKNGEKVRIIGKSGSGKTTLFKLILGFTRPQEGAIYYKNEKISAQNIWSIRRNIAYVSQDIQLGEGTVKHFFKDITGFKANRHLNITEKQIKEKLTSFALQESQFEQPLQELSGGEIQRIAIIASILLDRKVYLLDEATSNLDPELKKRVIDYFLQMEEKTVVFISHDELWEKLNIRTIDLDQK